MITEPKKTLLSSKSGANRQILTILRLTGTDSGGVVVAARMADARPWLGDQLAAGHIIHALNGTPVNDLSALRKLLESLKADSPLVIQIERAGLLRLIVLERVIRAVCHSDLNPSRLAVRHL